jgi:hypothetical protein
VFKATVKWWLLFARQPSLKTGPRDFSTCYSRTEFGTTIINGHTRTAQGFSVITKVILIWWDKNISEFPNSISTTT